MLLCLLLINLLLLHRVGLGLPLSAALSCLQPALPASCWRLACLPARACNDVSLSHLQSMIVFSFPLSLQALSIKGRAHHDRTHILERCACLERLAHDGGFCSVC